MRWQDLVDHHGPVASNQMSTGTIYFDGGYMSDGYSTDWSFSVNRLAGTAFLHREGKPNVNYTCAKASPKF